MYMCPSAKTLLLQSYHDCDIHKRGTKKIPHCLSKPKQSTYREDLPIEEETTTSSHAKRTTTQKQNPKE